MPRTDDTRAAMVLALGGFVLLSCGDAVVKSMARDWPPPAIATLRFALGAIGLGTILGIRTGAAAVSTVPLPALQLLRGAALGVATFGYFMAIRTMSLADAIAIVFVGPMITSVLSAVFLKERASRAVWVSCALAFAGVLIVLRPEVARLGAAALYPLLSAFGMSVLMIANRKTAGSATALRLQFLLAAAAFGFLLLFTLIGAALDVLTLSVPPALVVAKCVIVAITASTAHWLIFKATERASAAVVAPMTYIQLLVATLLGWVWFGDRPDLATLGGAAVIIFAGLYLWHAQRPRAGEVPLSD